MCDLLQMDAFQQQLSFGKFWLLFCPNYAICFITCFAVAVLWFLKAYHMHGKTAHGLKNLKFEIKTQG